MRKEFMIIDRKVYILHYVRNPHIKQEFPVYDHEFLSHLFYWGRKKAF